MRVDSYLCAGVPHNLAIKFYDDTIDETDVLASMLENDCAIASTLKLTVLSLPGDHTRPIRQEVNLCLLQAFMHNHCAVCLLW